MRSCVRPGILGCLLSLGMAGCGARTPFGDVRTEGAAPDSGAGAPAPVDTAVPAPGAPTLSALPCTGSSGTAVGLADAARTGRCRFHSAEPADPEHPDLQLSTNDRSISVKIVASAEACPTVNDQGWYLVPNVPGVIVAAPVVMTFELCPGVCDEIQVGEGWLLSIPVKTCR
jgi:hypothetical protein